MDFAFSPDQQLLRGAARAFLDEHVTPAAVRALWDDPRGERDDLWKEMARLGWLGLALPEAHGGSALGMVETAIVLEEMGRVACPGPYLDTVIAARALQAAGTPAQQARWLPAIAGGAARGAVAFLDAELDWRPEAVLTRAEPSPGGLRLTGVKQWTPWAHVADALLVPAREAEGLSLFLVEPGANGLSVSPVPAMDPGMRWSTVRLDGVRVGAEARVGAPGDRGRAARRPPPVGRGGGRGGDARGGAPLPRPVRRVRQGAGAVRPAHRVVPGHPAPLRGDAARGGERPRGDLLRGLGAGRGRRGPRARGLGGEGVRERGGAEVCGDAIQVHGGIGFTWEYDLHLYFKRAKTLEATWGDADYHRELIVRQVAG